MGGKTITVSMLGILEISAIDLSGAGWSSSIMARALEYLALRDTRIAAMFTFSAASSNVILAMMPGWS